MNTKRCPRCETYQKPKGLRFCNNCARQINLLLDDPLGNARALVCLANRSGHRETAEAGFIRLMHPTMPDRRLREIVKLL